MRALHEAQGHPYPFPDLAHPEFIGIAVAVDENDIPVQAVAARKTVEIFMLGDPNWRTPAWRLRTLKELHLVMHEYLLSQHFTDATAWLPPAVAKAFGRRLQTMFGWTPSVWQCFSKRL